MIFIIHIDTLPVGDNTAMAAGKSSKESPRPKSPTPTDSATTAASTPANSSAPRKCLHDFHRFKVVLLFFQN